VIVSSVFRLGVKQRDGRVRVHELHEDSAGGAHGFDYKALPSADHQAVMLARVPRIEAALAEAEFLEALDSDGWKPLVHQTPAQFAARLRARYKDSSQIECAKLAKWILDHIDAGYFTDAQVRNAFGLNVTKWNAPKAKMSDLRAKYESLLSARGE